MEDYLARILKSVSRSFYLSLKILPPSVRTPMGLGYLLCRLADTLADTDVLPFKEREKLLDSFNSLFDTFPIPEQKVSSLKKQLLESLTEIPSDERFLVENITPCIDALRNLSRTDQAFIHEVVRGVIKGMKMDLKTFGESAETIKSFQTKDQLEEYIKWIGGEPGRFWTQLTLHYFPHYNQANRDQLINKGIAFGKGLQMINILRDLPKDLQNGRCYIPQDRLDSHKLRAPDLLDPTSLGQFTNLYHQMIDETIDRLKHGLSYLESLPKGAFRMRASIWWPLVIALKTLGKLRTSNDILNPENRVKVSRGEIYRIMASSGFILFSRKLMRVEFEDLAHAASSSI